MEIVVLTERGAQLYSALFASGEWMTTAQLAEATGKNQLSPHDRDLLERMVEMGYLDRGEERKETFGRPARLYRCV